VTGSQERIGPEGLIDGQLTFQRKRDRRNSPPQKGEASERNLPKPAGQSRTLISVLTEDGAVQEGKRITSKNGR